MSIKKNISSDDINFVAEVSSVFHFLCVMSYAYKKSKEKFVNGIIFIRSHYVMNDPIEERIIEFENLKIELIRFSTDYKNLIIEKNHSNEGGYNVTGKLLYVLSVKVPNYKLFKICKKITDKKIKVVLFDEGTGTYYNFSGLFYPINTLIKKIFIFVQNTKIENYFLLKNNRGELTENKEVTGDFLNLISDRSDYIFKVDKKFRNNISTDKYAIFISGLFVEIGLINLEEYRIKLYKLNEILNHYGFKLLIKPYQSENLDKYEKLDIELLQWDIPCEILFPVIKPLYTLGFLSTSMLTGKVLYNIDSIDLSNVFGLKENKSYYSKYEKMFKLFDNFMVRCNNFEELSKIINSND